MEELLGLDKPTLDILRCILIALVDGKTNHAQAIWKDLAESLETDQHRNLRKITVHDLVNADIPDTNNLPAS